MCEKAVKLDVAANAKCVRCGVAQTEMVFMSRDLYLLRNGRSTLSPSQIQPLSIMFSGAPGWTFEIRNGGSVGLRCPNCQE